MEYITIKRFHNKGIDGDFNLPYGTICPIAYDFIMSPDGRSICKITSETGWTYFRPNTEEGRQRQIMLDKLYSYYEKGKGDTSKDFNPERWYGITNFYWKNILRTMSTEKLLSFYKKRLGEPDFSKK